jgi:hypothetical protein
MAGRFEWQTDRYLRRSQDFKLTIELAPPTFEVIQASSDFPEGSVPDMAAIHIHRSPCCKPWYGQGVSRVDLSKITSFLAVSLSGDLGTRSLEVRLRHVWNLCGDFIGANLNQLVVTRGCVWPYFLRSIGSGAAPMFRKMVGENITLGCLRSFLLSQTGVLGVFGCVVTILGRVGVAMKYWGNTSCATHPEIYMATNCPVQCVCLNSNLQCRGTFQSWMRYHDAGDQVWADCLLLSLPFQTRCHGQSVTSNLSPS